MALVVKDRVKESTSTTGTETITLSGAQAGFQSFSAALSDGDTTYYTLVESSTGAWEVGVGTYSLGTLSRDTILSSSNAGSAINLSAATDVFITQPADKSVFFDGSNNLLLRQDPTAALQAATKQYVDEIASAGVHYHDPVRAEAEGNLTATYDNGSSGVGATLTNAGTQTALVIDGVTVELNDRVLVRLQTDAAENGVYFVSDTGSSTTNWVLTRATDADSYGASDPDALGRGDAFFVRQGSIGAGETYIMNTEGTITFGTTPITFAQFSSAQIYSAGGGLTLSGTTFAVGAGTGVTVGADTVSIGQDVSPSADVSFNSVTAPLTGNVTGDVSGNATTASALQTARNIALTGAVTGSTTFDGSGNVSISTTATSDPTITLSGALSGSATLTNLGDATLTANVTANAVELGTNTTGDYVAAVTAGAAIDITGSGGEGSSPVVNLDLSKLATSTADADGDFFVVVDAANAQRKLTKANINISGFNNDAGYTTNVGDITGVTAGGGLSGGGASGNVTVSHADTSAQGSVNNSGGTVIQDVTLDTYGHVTSIGSVNLDSRYYTETEADARFVNADGDTVTGNLTIDAALFLQGGTSVATDTVTNAGAVLAQGQALYSLRAGYNRVLIEHRSDSGVIDIGESGTAIISGINLKPGGSGTAQVNGHLIWHAGNDGAGSGLDADLLDGVQGSSYLRSDQSDTLSGNLTVTGDIFIEDSAIVFNNDAGAIAKIQNNGGDLHLFSDASIRFYESDATVTRATIDVNNGRMRIGDSANPTNTLEVVGKSTFTGVSSIFAGGNQLLLHPTGTQETVIHRNDGSNYYILLSDPSATPSEAWNSLRPLHIELATGLLKSNNGQNFLGGTTTSSLTVSGVALAESLQEDYDALSGTTPTINANTGGAFSLSTTGNTTFTFSSVTSGRGVGFVLEVTAGGTHTLTWPASVKWAGGTAPDAPASGETNIYVFYTRNGGTTWYGAQSIDAAA